MVKEPIGDLDPLWSFKVMVTLVLGLGIDRRR